MTGRVALAICDKLVKLGLRSQLFHPREHHLLVDNAVPCKRGLVDQLFDLTTSGIWRNGNDKVVGTSVRTLKLWTFISRFERSRTIWNAAIVESLRFGLKALGLLNCRFLFS